MQHDIEDPGFCAGVEGCGGYFSRKTTQGLCSQCDLIHKFEVEGNAQRAADIRSYPQCEDCGAAGKNFKANVCGGCTRQRQSEIGREVLAEQVVQDVHEARAAATQHRGLDGRYRPPAPPLPRHQPAPPVNMRPPPPPSQHSRPPVAPIPVTQPSRPAATARNISISFQPMCTNKKDGKITFLGTLIRTHPADTTMRDVIQDYLNHLNVDWEKKTSKSVTRADVHIRFAPNIIPETECEDETLADFYDSHHVVEHRAGYFGKLPQELKHIKGQLIAVIVRIDVEHWELRTGLPSPTRTEKEVQQWQKAQQKKRLASCFTEVDGEVKRLRTSIQPLRSTYIPYQRMLPPVIPTTPIRLAVARYKTSDAGQWGVSWKDEHITLRDAELADKSFAAGATKQVYKIKVIVDGSPENYVAKRFFEIGHGDGVVSCDDNLQCLQQEGERLSRGEYFLTKFYEESRKHGVEVFHDFRFSAYSLVREIFTTPDQDEQVKSTGPSPASGLTLTEWDELPWSDQDAGIVWLLEPERSTIVERWSGTMEHPSHIDKRGATLTAFVHFAYVYSLRTLVFADLQTSSGKIAGTAKKASILFDVMTHTETGDSGVGDHGEAGIEKFLSDHTCNDICRDLQLRPLTDSLEVRKRIVARHRANKYSTDDESSEEESSGEEDNGNGTEASGPVAKGRLDVGYESPDEDQA